MDDETRLRAIADAWVNEFSQCKRNRAGDGMCVQCVELLKDLLKEPTYTQQELDEAYVRAGDLYISLRKQDVVELALLWQEDTDE
jgi:hypothetical protein